MTLFSHADAVPAAMPPPISGWAAVDRITDALGAPNVIGEENVSAFVVRRFVGRGQLVYLSLPYLLGGFEMVTRKIGGTQGLRAWLMARCSRYGLKRALSWQECLAPQCCRG
ncbi:hypothetical protein [Streptomyces atroolivaceus]|uniref:hypothetical protein n=1 Tax=Streptomyces atroolivaceus TaxID=66869 RepID=UPI003644A48A